MFKTAVVHGDVFTAIPVVLPPPRRLQDIAGSEPHNNHEWQCEHVVNNAKVAQPTSWQGTTLSCQFSDNNPVSLFQHFVLLSDGA
jgi:hypothetical protein